MGQWVNFTGDATCSPRHCHAVNLQSNGKTSGAAQPKVLAASGRQRKTATASPVAAATLAASPVMPGTWAASSLVP